jgi:hypothetical protein
LCARFERYEEKGDMDYVTSRKEVYCKEYYELIENRERTLYWKKLLDEGKSITIYDFDGPRNEDKGVTCVELTVDLLKEKIEDVKFHFGHCYVVGCALVGIELSEFC